MYIVFLKFFSIIINILWSIVFILQRLFFL